jgi:hypothetical protein
MEGVVKNIKKLNFTSQDKYTFQTSKTTYGSSRRLFKKTNFLTRSSLKKGRVPDPDPPDLHVFGPPGSGSISQRYGSG